MTGTQEGTTTTQRAHWDSVAKGWAEWWPVIEEGARPVTERLLELAALEPGGRALDLASGIGEPAASAARRVGPQGRVLATDIAPSMVEAGRERMRRLGLDNVEFRLMDAAAPDLPEGNFDAVLCRWGLMFVPDLSDTLVRLHRLLKPGGRLAAAVWGPPEQVPAISLASRILSEHLDMPKPSNDDRGPFELSDIGAFEAKLAAAGFTDVRREAVSVVYDFASVETHIAFRREVSRIEQQIAENPPERREAAWRAVADALKAFADGDGRVRLENLCFCVGGRRA
ncbi:MAG: methyltransferase domain-containing protein [Rhodospirillales bacterium]|nr:methyltransferase domain-containing protein [Rhodospirillales bacterium]